MKKLILTAGICLSSLLCVQAQAHIANVANVPTKSHSKQVDKIVTNMTNACKLTPQQVTDIKPIVAEFLNAKAANKQQYASDKDKRKEANQASRKAMNVKLAKVLTADQQAQWAAYAKTKKAANATSTNTNSK